MSKMFELSYHVVFCVIDQLCDNDIYNFSKTSKKYKDCVNQYYYYKLNNYQYDINANYMLLYLKQRTDYDFTRQLLIEHNMMLQFIKNKLDFFEYVIILNQHIYDMINVIVKAMTQYNNEIEDVYHLLNKIESVIESYFYIYDKLTCVAGLILGIDDAHHGMYVIKHLDINRYIRYYVMFLLMKEDTIPWSEVVVRFDRLMVDRERRVRDIML